VIQFPDGCVGSPSPGPVMAKAAQPTRRHAAAPALPAAATSSQAPGRPTPLVPQAATSGSSNLAAATACLNTCGNRRTPARSDTGAATGLNARPPANTAQRPSLPSDPPPGSAPLPAGLQLTASRRSSQRLGWPGAPVLVHTKSGPDGNAIYRLADLKCKTWHKVGDVPLVPWPEACSKAK
jgi:hypothetical protein